MSAAVIKGEAGHDLLDTYEAERRAIAIANTELSVSNWKEALKVPQALGLDPAAANALQRAVTSRPASILPSGGVTGNLVWQSIHLASFMGCELQIGDETVRVGCRVGEVCS